MLKLEIESNSEACLHILTEGSFNYLVLLLSHQILTIDSFCILKNLCS